LTDKRMKRFFMTKDDAVDLILHAAELSQGGETFVLKMPIIQLIDLFEAMKIVLAPKFGLKPSQIKTKIIGIRRGEKLTENLLTNYELSNVLETKDFFIIPKYFDLSKKYNYRGVSIPKNPQNFFKDIKPLSQNQIVKILKKIY
jgi:UDP-N-acetylglucosamine 4,6-dehydratase/5-epimerase